MLLQGDFCPRMGPTWRTRSCDIVGRCSTSYNKAARPKRAAPAAPVKPVGRAAATFPVSVAPEALADAPLAAELMAEEAEEAAPPALLVALLATLPTSLEMLDRIELAAEVKEARDEEAPVALLAAAELRLERLDESADSAELALLAMDDSADAAEDEAAAAELPAADVIEAIELDAEAAAPDPEALGRLSVMDEMMVDTPEAALLAGFWAKAGTAARRRTRLVSCMIVRARGVVNRSSVFDAGNGRGSLEVKVTRMDCYGFADEIRSTSKGDEEQ